MKELDRVWAQMIADARAKAEMNGRGDVAEYLALKANNDAIRAAGTEWLFNLALELAAETNRINAAITIENENPHRFAFGNSNLAGSLMRLRQGIRCLTIEAGWTRTPADGFMRGGALAAARISHFGMSKYNQELILTTGENSPGWFSVGADGKRNSFDSKDLRLHFRLFLS